MDFLLFIILAGAVIAIVFTLALRQAKQARTLFQKFAQEQGLTFEDPPMFAGLLSPAAALSGQMRGRAVRFFSFSTGTGKSRQTWRALSVSCSNPKRLAWRLSKQGILNAIGEWFGMQDVRVGTPAFDEAFVVKTNAPEFFCAALLPELQATLLDAWKGSRSGAYLKLEHDAIIYAEHGFLANQEALDRLLRWVGISTQLAALPESFGA